MAIIIGLIVGLLMCVIVSYSLKPRLHKAEFFFREWLISHGETNIVVDEAGVGVAGNATRLKASICGFEKQDEGYVAEVEFRVHLPSNEEIVESLFGAAKTRVQAVYDAYRNFTVTTFHVIYKGFMNPSDPHQTEISIEIHGRMRAVLMGDTCILGVKNDPELCTEIYSVESQMHDVIATMPLSNNTHWFKIIYSHIHHETQIAAVMMDNQDHDGLTQAIKNLNWPKREEGYFVKQFILVKPADEAQPLITETRVED